MNRSERRGAWLWVAALPLCLACSSKKLSVEKVEVEEASLHEVGDLSWTATAARNELVAQLKKARFVVVPDGESGPDRALRLKLSLSAPVSDEEQEQNVAEVGAELQLRFKGDPASRALYASARRTLATTGLEERREAYQAAAKSALEKLAQDTYALASAEVQTDEDLVKALDSRSLAEKHAAIRVLAERKNRAAVAPLLEQLKLDDPDLVRQAIGGLVEIGDPKAVPGLIEASRAKDDVFQREIVFALGSLGGEDAEAYLFTVAQGTENPVLRGSAEQALKELKARESKDGGS